MPDALLHRGLIAWAALFGTVSFELFGRVHGLVGDQPGDRETFFAESVRRWAEQAGISPARTDTAADARPLKPAGAAEKAARPRITGNIASLTAKKASP